MKKVSKTKESILGSLIPHEVFTANDLQKIEEVRKDFYTKDNLTKIEKDYDFPNFKFGKILGYGQDPSTRRHRYLVANDYYKRFVEDKNFNNILAAISFLQYEAMSCPVILTIFAHLYKRYYTALSIGDKKLRNEIKRYAQQIGPFILDIYEVETTKKQQKIAPFFRRLHIIVEARRDKTKKSPTWTGDPRTIYDPHQKWRNVGEHKPGRRHTVREDVLIYIKKLYEKHKKETKKSHNVTASLILKERDRLKNLNAEMERISKRGDSNQLQKLQRDRVALKLDIAKWEKEQENQVYREARKKTLDDLANETGIRISSRSFDKILAVINQLNSPDFGVTT